MDAKTLRGDGGAGGKYPSLLEDFQTDTASMARKSHLASSARGFLLFLSCSQIEVQEFKGFKRFKRFKSVLFVYSVVEKKLPEDRVLSLR